MRKHHFLILWGIFAILYLILNIIFSFKFAEYKLEDRAILLEIKNSLEGKLIYSFELKPNCSSEEEQLSLGKVDGFDKGCKCNNAIKKDLCSENDIKIGCENMNYSIEFKTINSNYICIKKSNKSYKDLMKSKQILPKGSNCPINFILCGIIDTLGNILCIPDNEKCPITIADIQNSNLIYKNNNSYNRESTNNSQIISIIKSTDNNLPCINPEENNLDDKKCRTKIFGNLYDNRYEKIDEINTTKYDLYKDNFSKDYNNVKNTMNETVYLYARNFIGFEYKSIDKYNYENIISKQKKLNKYGKNLKYYDFFFKG